MYLDLQGNTIKRDLALTQIQALFGEEMLAFLIQPSQYQAALDASLLPLNNAPITKAAIVWNTAVDTTIAGTYNFKGTDRKC